MLKVRSVRFNFIMNIILTASNIIFPLITYPYVSRVLLPAGVGKVNFATSVVSYFSMIAVLGVPTYGIRACAQVRDDKEELSRRVQEILIINLGISIFVYAAYFGAICNIPRLQQDAGLFYVMGTTIIFNVVGMEWLYKGLEQYSYIAVRSILFKFLGIVLMFLLVRDTGDYIIYGAISIFAGVGSNILNFLNARKFVSVRPVWKYCFRRHWKPIVFFFMMSVATTIYTNLDTVMLGFMKSDVDVGYYSTAVKVKGLLVSFVTALSTVLLPRVSYYIEQGLKEEFVRVSQKALDFIVVIALPVSAYFVLYAKESIYLLSGENFTGSIVPMQIIMPTVFFIGLTNVIGMQILVPLGKEKLVFVSVTAGAIIDLIINYITIPVMASSGAALGTLIAEAVVLVVQLWVVRKQIRVLFGQVQFLKILVSVILSSFCSVWIKMLALGNLLSLILSGGIFAVVYGVCLLWMKEPFAIQMLTELKKFRLTNK